MTTPSPPPDGFRFEDPRQERIYKRLALLGPGPAAFFRDACLLMGQPTLETTTHVVAHLLREIESAIRAVLEPIAAASEDADSENRHEAKIRTVLAVLEIEEGDPVAQAWLDLAGRDDSSLHGRAHRRSLLYPRPADLEFKQFWEDTQQLLDVVLDKFEARFLAVFGTLDELLEKATPSKKDMTRLKNTVPHNRTTLEYVFDRLESPAWLGPLVEHGFFQHPPGPEYDDDGEHFRLPRWAQSRYLVRIAADAPEEVIQTILAIPDTNNPRVHEDYVDAALEVPAAVATTLAEKIAAWLDGPLAYTSFRLADKVAEYVAFLAEDGRSESVALAKTLLVVRPDPRSESDAEAAEYQLPPTPQSRFQHGDYGEVLSKVNVPLTKAAPAEWFEALCVLLNDAVRLSFREESRKGDEGLSYVWRPAIEDHGQNRPDDSIADQLVGAVRDVAEARMQDENGEPEEIITALEGQEFKIFHRVALHLLRVHAPTMRRLLATRLTTREYFDDPDFHHEYYVALEECFGLLNEEEQATTLGWIDQGRDRKEVEEHLAALDGEVPTDDEVDEFIERRRLRRLFPLREHLTGDWRDRYTALVKRFGEPEHPDFLSYHYPIWSGPTSPRDANEITAMSVEELTKFLRTWQQTEEWRGPSPEGLSRSIAAAVSQEPQRFADDAHQFIGLDPTYVRAVIDGLGEVVKNGGSIAWSSVLALCEWVVEQPRTIVDRPEVGRDADPDWGWTLKAIARFLGYGFESKECSVPIGSRDRVWKILEKLAEDPEPTEEYESRYGGDNMDPNTLSINTVRGDALHGVIKYALWLRAQIESERDPEDRLKNGFAEMPEVKQLLKVHLDVTQDPSLAIRSVYGRWFPWLALLDQQWAANHVADIFPGDEKQTGYWRASWDAYIGFNRPYKECFKLLTEEYRRAIQEIGGASVEDRKGFVEPHRKLIDHLMEFYWRGIIGLESGGLLETFYEIAPEWARAEAMEHIGRSLCNADGSVDAEILGRLKSLWEFRLARIAIKGDEGHALTELAAFGWWFRSGKLDDSWSLMEFKSVLESADKLRRIDASLVIERLVELAREFPGLTLDCLIMLIEKDDEGWHMFSWDQEAREIFTAALESGQEPVRKSAEEFIQRQAARGDLRFRALVE